MSRVIVHTVLRSGLISALLVATPALADGVTITDKDAGKTISVASGQPLTVRLPGVRGEGYWRLDSDLTPELSLSGRTTESVLAPNAPETTIFSFATRTPGTVTLKASYVKNGAPANSFSVLVTVSQS
ncbi:MAG TPA: protease inhibitor I42 family protein [Rhizomicrobium sp.]|nr:protease inhibitor I42 family protein [Rhizomicrobium sp.]